MAEAGVDAFVSHFQGLERTMERGGRGWRLETRRAAIRRFAELGFPTTKDEEWKYTNLAPIARTAFRPAAARDPHGVIEERLEPFTFGVLKCTQLVFVNGHYSPRLSWRRSLPEGVRVASVAEAYRDDPGALQALGRLAPFESEPFTALNTALFQDGALVDVPAGTALEEPIHLLFLSSVAADPIASFPRNVIRLGERSRATVIETYAALDGESYFTDAVTEIALGPEAVLDHYKLQREGENAFHVARTEVLQDRASNFASSNFDLGGALVRNDTNTKFAGEGGELAMNGLFMLGGKQHVDNHTRIDHAAPSCTSAELYKGILDGASKGIFNGKIFVRKEAQKTVARQTNKNLLLSKEAFVDSTPGLMILADDVKCNHGSTIGQLSEDALFYMRSRGIDEAAARNMLTFAFAGEMVNRVRVAPMRVKVNEMVVRRLPYTHAAREVL